MGGRGHSCAVKARAPQVYRNVIGTLASAIFQAAARGGADHFRLEHSAAQRALRHRLGEGRAAHLFLVRYDIVETRPPPTTTKNRMMSWVRDNRDSFFTFFRVDGLAPRVFTRAAAATAFLRRLRGCLLPFIGTIFRARPVFCTFTPSRFTSIVVSSSPLILDETSRSVSAT